MTTWARNIDESRCSSRTSGGEGLLPGGLRPAGLFEDENSAVFKFGDTVINLLAISERRAHRAGRGRVARGRIAVPVHRRVDDVDAMCEVLMAAAWSCSTARWTGPGVSARPASATPAVTSGRSPSDFDPHGPRAALIVVDVSHPGRRRTTEPDGWTEPSSRQRGLGDEEAFASIARGSADRLLPGFAQSHPRDVGRAEDAVQQDPRDGLDRAPGSESERFEASTPSDPGQCLVCGSEAGDQVVCQRRGPDDRGAIDTERRPGRRDARRPRAWVPPAADGATRRLVLHHYLGLSLGEIAETLDVPTGTVSRGFDTPPRRFGLP